MNGWEFNGGDYTGAGNTPAANVDIGVRIIAGGRRAQHRAGPALVLCDKIDFGVAGFFNLSSGSIGNELLQVDFRWRF